MHKNSSLEADVSFTRLSLVATSFVANAPLSLQEKACVLEDAEELLPRITGISPIVGSAAGGADLTIFGRIV